MDSFDNKIPSSGYVQTVTDCQLIVFPKRNWEEISNTITGWEKYRQKIINPKSREKKSFGVGRRHNAISCVYGKFLLKCTKVFKVI